MPVILTSPCCQAVTHATILWRCTRYKEPLPPINSSQLVIPLHALRPA